MSWPELNCNQAAYLKEMHSYKNRSTYLEVLTKPLQKSLQNHKINF